MTAVTAAGTFTDGSGAAAAVLGETAGPRGGAVGVAGRALATDRSAALSTGRHFASALR